MSADFEEELTKLGLCLNGLQATLETPYDELFIAQKRAILRLKGIGLLTIQIEPLGSRSTGIPGIYQAK